MAVGLWVKRIFLAGMLLFVLGGLAFYAAGRFAIAHYLRKPIVVGEGNIHVMGATLGWSLDFSVDSIVYESPTFLASSQQCALHADLFRSFLHFAPAITLNVNALQIDLLPDTLTKPKKPFPDSIPFPSFKIPVAAKISVEKFILRDSLGEMIRLSKVTVTNPNPKAVNLEIKEIQSRFSKSLLFSLQSENNWINDSVIASIRIQQGSDQIQLQGHAPKSNLLLAIADLQVKILSSQPYNAVFLPNTKLPILKHLDFTFSGQRNLGYIFHSKLKTEIDHLPSSSGYQLSPQKVMFTLQFNERLGNWLLKSQGKQGEDLLFKGHFDIMSKDSLRDVAYLSRYIQATAIGHVHGVALKVGGHAFTGSIDFQAPYLSSKALQANVITGDSSRITVNLNKASSGWKGEFSVLISPQERWARAFVDSNVDFQKIFVQGHTQQNQIDAFSDIYALKAYGTMADSIHLVHHYQKSKYELYPSTWTLGKVTWKLSGLIQLDKRNKPMQLKIANAEYGSIEASIPAPNEFAVHSQNLSLEQLPYGILQHLDSLFLTDSRLNLDFAWNKKTSVGHLETDLQAQYKKQKVAALISANWDKELLHIPQVKAVLEGMALQGDADLVLHEKPFYALYKIHYPNDVQHISIAANHFNIAKAMQVAMVKPPLRNGEVDGKFTYSYEKGFVGGYEFSNIQMADSLPATLRKLSLQGDGDTLSINAVTVSDKEPLLRDSLQLALTGVLADSQSLQLKAIAGGSLFLNFQGGMHAFKDLQGHLQVTGKIPLPGNSGELRDLQISAYASLPFKAAMVNLLLDADILQTRYLLPGLDTQSISAPLHIRQGQLNVPIISAKGLGGELKGNLNYQLIGKHIMSAHVEGSSFSAKIGDLERIRIRDFKADANSDSSELTFQSYIGSGSAEHVKPPLRVAGDFSRMQIFYTAPLGSSDNKSKIDYSEAPIPYLQVRATLDSSILHYRLRSLETLQNLFKQTPEVATSKRLVKRASKPLQLDLNLETSGTGNHVETDVLRFNYVGDISIAGIYPYTLMQGRITGLKGELGTKDQAFTIKNFELKWLNVPIDEGELQLEAQKSLAKTCEVSMQDSCKVITRLTGNLNDLKFAYDSDCQGAYGAGAEISALIYSVRRGCYSPLFSSGGSVSYQEAAYGLLEPLASSYLTKAANKLSGNWISNAQVSGLGALATDKKMISDSTHSGSSTSAASAGNSAVAIEILSKEFWRLRMRARYAYTPDKAENTNPGNYRLALEWRPPPLWLINDQEWKKKIKNNISVEAAIFTDPDRLQQEAQNNLRKRLSLNYNYNFWGTHGSVHAKKSSQIKSPAIDSSLEKKP